MPYPVHLRLSEIPYREARLAIAKALLALLRNGHATHLPGTSFAASLDELLVMVAVFIGHCEAKPFSVTKISGYLDMPRATALRRLESLEGRGAIYRHGNTYLLVVDTMGDESKIKATHRAVKIVRDAATSLSKLVK